jgi:hypothetical protein
VATRMPTPLELTKGDALGTLEIDHRCHNKLCVNPDHLRAATHKPCTGRSSGQQATAGNGSRVPVSSAVFTLSGGMAGTRRRTPGRGGTIPQPARSSPWLGRYWARRPIEAVKTYLELR